MNRKDKWEIRFGFFGTAFAGLSVIASVFIYLDGNEAALERENELIATRNAVEYQRRLWDERRAAYKDLAETLGAIAAELDAGTNVSDESRRSFNKAYWGALILVENDRVEQEMVKLRNDLRDLEEQRITGDKIKLRIQRVVTLSKKHILENIGEISAENSD